MSRAYYFFAGMAAGAVLMYVLDPSAGERRRDAARDAVLDWANDVQDYALKTSRRLGDRARELGSRAEDLAAEARSRVGLSG